ncbi:MAG: hypothetical protein H7Z13_01285 [Ferruginibacter sp.]|nr:hypothetical protein [Ferruginibacter sp.]
MKSLKLPISLLFAAFLSSCIDTEEKIVLNADNSGIYSMTIDLGRMLKIAGSMGGEKSDSSKTKEKRDTTVYLKDMIDTAVDLTASEKALYKDGMIHVKLDEEKNEMKIVMSSPFKNAADLTEIKNNFSTVLNKLKALNKATGEQAKPEGELADMDMRAKSTNPVSEHFTFVAGTGKISSTITNLATFKKLVATDSTLGMMSQMTSMMGDFNYRTIIVLPKVVKKFNGPGTVVSADKKTVSFSTTLTEMLEHPEKVSYDVEY